MRMFGEEDEEGFCVCNKLSVPEPRQVEPVGRWYEAFCLRQRGRHHSHSRTSFHNSSGEHDGLEEVEDEDEDEDEVETGEEDADEVNYLKNLDPKLWKEQDHYRVLGLRETRYKASDSDIKKAYKRKVLLHHPDKRQAKRAVSEDDDYFTCITRAYEIVGNPVKRRAYDSVDPEFDSAIPSTNAHSRENFYETFDAVFFENSRWSVDQPVPQLGTNKSTFEEVDNFYSFWYDFDSWREFSYEDEDDKEKGENRDERRWIDKNNRVARKEKKKEEVARLRTLVDNAYACDPRIQRFKDEKKQEKEEQKRVRQEAARGKMEEEKRLREAEREEARRIKQQEDEEARAQAAVAKRQKDAQKKVLKKERKSLRSAVKDADYFVAADDDATRLANMEDVEMLCERLEMVELQALNETIAAGNAAAARDAFNEQVKKMRARIEKEKAELLAAERRDTKGGSTASTTRDKDWTEEEIQILIKAVNLFPAGTNQRWEVVANYINQHSTTNSDKNAKETLGMAKKLQKDDFVLKEDANKKAFEKFQQRSKAADTRTTPADESAPSARYETPAEMMGLNTSPWTTDEQKRLEQALKTYPSSTAERWDRIADAIPNRSKKDCIKRYKELAEMVKAKKAAQQAAAKSARS
ncbi:PREDICTED: dnaJ homolog subfamily C member 2-like [Priapulus caudatus]|uniref:DnaJ homolog subfamily C member 2 n=1 Tax=Priapulus caudatus TaxID=37621 RepID=A0ABM1EF92_PRICU|nr:PREDICTED: dnaJ homolog subfamily C member 2-like [Priapulus caudatus]